MSDSSDTASSQKSVFDFLVVDDQEIMQGAIRNMLRSNGPFKVALARDGQEALKILGESKVGFVITDWNMPNIDGITLLHEVRRHPDLFDIPILMVSDEASRENFLYAIAEGVDGFQIKPFVEKDLIISVSTIIKNRQSMGPNQKHLVSLRRLRLVGKYEEAITGAEELLKDFNSPEVYYLLAECHFEMKNFDKAAKCLDEVMKHTPNSRIYDLYGQVMIKQKNYEGAAGHFEQAMNLNPLDLNLQIQLIEALFGCGKESKAIEIYLQFIDKGPKANAMFAVGKILLQNEQLLKAGYALNQVPDHWPELFDSVVDLAGKLAAKKMTNESIIYFERCLRINPRSFAVMTNLVKLYMQQGKIDKAISISQKMVRMNPEDEKSQKIFKILMAKKENKEQKIRKN